MSQWTQPIAGLWALRMLALAVLPVLVGCSYTVSRSGPGALTFTPPGRLPGQTQGVASAPPPPGMERNAALTPALPPSGMYAGLARLDNHNGQCGDPLRVSQFFVRGNRVDFGAYKGTIRPDGSLKMQYGPSHVYGQFYGAHFEGRFWRPGPGCTYHLFLDRKSA